MLSSKETKIKLTSSHTVAHTGNGTSTGKPIARFGLGGEIGGFDGGKDLGALSGRWWIAEEWREGHYFCARSSQALRKPEPERKKNCPECPKRPYPHTKHRWCCVSDPYCNNRNKRGTKCRGISVEKNGTKKVHLL